MTEVRRRGRPSKAETVVLGAMRLPADVYDGLRQEAEQEGRSITAQAERRLRRRQNDVGLAISLVVDLIEQRAGSSWLNDGDVRFQCRAAADQMLDRIFGQSISSNSDEQLSKPVGDVSDADWKRMELEVQARASADEAADFISGARIAE